MKTLAAAIQATIYASVSEQLDSYTPCVHALELRGIRNRKANFPNGP